MLKKGSSISDTKNLIFHPFYKLDIIFYSRLCSFEFYPTYKSLRGIYIIVLTNPGRINN